MATAGGWGHPLFDRPAEPNHVSASLDAGANVALAFSHRCCVSPWHHPLRITDTGPVLAASAVVRLVSGDTATGSPGWAAPTASLPDHRFVGVAHCGADALWVRLSDLPPLRIVAGSATVMAASCTSACVVGEVFRITVRGIDRWGNVNLGGTGTPELGTAGLAVVQARRIGRDGAPQDLGHMDVRADRAGTERPRLRWGDLTAEANPVRPIRTATACSGRAVAHAVPHDTSGSTGTASWRSRRAP